MYKRFAFFPFTTLSSSNFVDHLFSLFFSKQASPSLEYILRSHALILTSGNSENPFIASKLISHYASLRKPSFSTQVFLSVRLKDVFLWNSVIKSHFSNGDHEEVLNFFLRMRASGFTPGRFTFPMVVVSCADLGLVQCGSSVHGLASKLGFCSGDSALGSSLVYMYSKYGQMGNACKLFDEITDRDVIVWTALVIGYVQNGESREGLKCLSEMHRSGSGGERPNFRTLQGGFLACGNLGSVVEGKSLHALAVKTGIGCSEDVKSSTLSMYSKCGSHVETYVSFSELTQKDVVSWMSVISVYSRLGLMSECANFFREMQISGTFPDEMIVSCMLYGFGNSMGVLDGKAFHGLIIKQFYSLGELVDDALVSMYSNFGLLNVAEKLSSRKPHLTKDSCGALISGYSKNGDSVKCIEMFRQMKNRGMEVNSDTLVSIISSCCDLGARRLGQSLHCYLIKNSMDEIISVGNLLIDMYGKSRDLPSAWRLFICAKKDIVTWNTMISCHINNENFSCAITLFDKMISENINPNQATLVIVLSACSHLASLEKGRAIHRLVEERGLEINLSLATALVDMYAKCGQLEKSRDVFNSMKDKDVVLWNVMISGYGMHGHADSAIDLFRDMENSNVKPNEVTFLALLLACTHAGLVEQGKCLFSRMQDCALTPNLKHYTCMVDLLGRSGNLLEAEDLILSMPVSPDGGVWGSLLSACVKHNRSEIGIRVARHAIEFDPGNDGYYITLSNMYSCSGMWDKAEDVRRIMKERRVGKEAGWSVV